MLDKFPDNLRNARIKKHMTQVKLAEESGVSVDTIRGWEQGKNLPHLDSALMVAEALDVTLNELVY